MKMVKSLFLGTAAGVVAMSGAQAADLPVKAKPVQYVKICSLYGAGFYYIPGTDMCLKIGGYVRQQVGWGVNGNLTNGGNAANVETRGTQNFAMRSRGYITADARNQTEYGTIRSYIAVGLSGAPDPASGASNTFSANRAFIQFAGFTFGITQSFYDFYSGPAASFFGGLINPSSDTGDGGKAVTAYTAQFGNGFSASIGIEGQRNTGVVGPVAPGVTTTLNNFATPIALPTTNQKAMQFPDVVANLRIDQAWGGAQIMGALHDASGQYYGGGNAAAVGSLVPNGHPSDKLGWAVGAGVKILTPMLSAGDYFQAQVNYSQGALGYLNAAGIAMYSKYNGGAGGSFGYGITSDGVYGTGPSASAVDLTTGWNVNASYEHYWSKSWQTSLYGGYQAISYNDTANANLCANNLAGVNSTTGAAVATATALFSGAPVTPAAGCNNNWKLWNVGSRTQWNIDSQTAMGIDIVYQRLETASKGLVTTIGLGGSQPSALRTLADQSTWMGQFRIHRNFYP